MDGLLERAESLTGVQLELAGYVAEIAEDKKIKDPQILAQLQN